MSAKAKSAPVRTKRKKTSRFRAVKRITAILFVLGVILVGVGYAVMAGKMRDAATKLASLDKQVERLETQPSIILSSSGKTLYQISAEYREPVHIDEVPKIVRDATLAAEDKRFYDHSGVDTKALFRVLFTNVREGRTAQGGSTLTMQLAKRLFNGDARTFDRKLDDIAMALMIERKYTKNQILEMYLNQVFYGSGAYGIKAAAKVYFGKDLDELTIGEAALLSRLVQRPSRDNPFVNPERAIQKRDDVLSTMREEKMITESEYDKAKHEKLKLAHKKETGQNPILSAPYFVNFVKDQLRKDLPDIDLSAGGYRIETTLDDDIQRTSEQQVAKLVETYRKRGVTTAAFISMDETGRILSMVGGVDYDRNQFNAVTQGRRQPGSSFKPIVYSAAIDRGLIDPNGSISSARFSYEMPPGQEPWTPDNSNGKYGGEVSIRTAIAMSINTAAARVMKLVSPEVAVQYAHDVFGITTTIPAVPSIVLGAGEVSPLEMAQAYSVFMLRGDRATPFGITKVVGPDGTILKKYGPEIARNVLSSDVATAIDGCLRSVVTSGTGTVARAVQDARGKTGTTSDNKDAWFCGYTNNILGVGWISNEQYDEGRKRWVYREMPKVFGGTVTVTMWTPIMLAAQKKLGPGTPREEFPFKSRGDSATNDDPSVVPDTTDINGDPLGPKTDGDPAKIGDDGSHGGDPSTKPVKQEPPPTPPVDGTPPTEVPKAEPPPKSKETKPEFITVDICAESGDVATIYCPETIPKSFAKSRVPKRRCRIHKG